MKFILILLVAGVASGGYIGPTALVDTGSSTQFRTQDNIGNYAFGYDEDHATGGTFRKETGDVYGNKVGSYGLKDIDGRFRIVNYVADAHGFRANIQSNEPGVAPQDAAGVSVNKAPVVVDNAVVAPVAKAAAPLVAAPISHAPLVAAPISHAPLVAAPISHAPVYAPTAHAYSPLAAAPSITYAQAISPYVSYHSPAYTNEVYAKGHPVGSAYAPTFVDGFRYGHRPYYLP